MTEARNKQSQDCDVCVGDTFAHRRGRWERAPEGLSPGYQRLLNLAGEVEKQQGPMGELRHALLCGCRARQDDPQRYIAAPHPGFLLCQGLHSVGKVRGLGEMQEPGHLFLESVVDAHCSLAFARLYLSHSAAAAVDILRVSVLPFYEQQGLKVERILTDNSRAYGRRPDHLYETTLTLAGIAHIRCASLPAAGDNPFCAQFHRILDEEFFGPTLRRDFHLHLDKLQSNLDAFLKHYNCTRACPGTRTQGRTPFRAFLDAVEARRAPAMQFAAGGL